MNSNVSLWRHDLSVTKHALSVARAVVSGDDAVRDLTRYYTVDSDYAGSTFANLQPIDPHRITPTDLLATTMLSVDIPPIAVRRLTGSGETATRATELLQQLDPHLDITDGKKHVETMSEFYELVKSSLRKAGNATSNAWVTASKICARKRPHLFPVRDNKVMSVLGLKGNYPDDWPVFSALISDEHLMSRVDAAVAAASEAGADVGDASMRLKHLDTLLWMSRNRSS